MPFSDLGEDQYRTFVPPFSLEDFRPCLTTIVPRSDSRPSNSRIGSLRAAWAPSWAHTAVPAAPHQGAAVPWVAVAAPRVAAALQSPCPRSPSPISPPRP